MDSKNAYDRVRAHLLGLLDADQARELERELERDPELREFAESWREVHGWIAPMRDEVPASRVTFDHLRAELEREPAPRASPWIRRAAAAAVLVLGGAGAWLAYSRATRAPEPLKLAAIELVPDAIDAAPLDLPERLASYEPIRNGEIQWIPSLEEGLRVAAAADRPILLFGMFETCPLCIHMKQNGLRDEAVLALVEDYVPVQIDYTTAGQEAIAEVFATGYPRFEIYAPDGALGERFPGVHEAPQFVEHLSGGLATLPSGRQPPTWDTVRRTTSEYEEALAAEEARRFGEAHRAYSALAREDNSGAIPRGAREGLARIAHAAASIVERARTQDGGGASATLEQALRDFGGTPYESDLARLLERTRHEGRVPELSAE